MSYAYGVILVIVGSIGNNLGNNLVSLGHKTNHEKITTAKELPKGTDLTSAADLSEMGNSIKEEEKESFISWTNVGRIVFVVGSLFTFASFAFGAQSLIASLESVQFVSNVVFVYYVHHEPITRRMLLATLSIVSGNVLVVVFGEHAAKKFTSDDMIHLYRTNNIYHGYMVLAFIAWAVSSYAYNTYHHSRMSCRKLMWNHSFMEPFCYAVSSSIIGTQAVLNSKCLALLLDATTTGAKNEFTFWYFYFVLGSWLILVGYWLTRLDAGLALFPPCFIIPVMQVFFVFFAIVCGGIYFQEFNKFSLSQYIGFIVGVLMILFGVYGLAPMDMKLYVPGDPDAPDVTKICAPCGGGAVHSELVLPGLLPGLHCNTDANANGCSLDVMDAMFDGALHKKPQPSATPAQDTELTDLNIYSTLSNVDGDTSVASMFDQHNGQSGPYARTPKSPGCNINRKVVKRPVVELSLSLPPVSTRGVNGLGGSVKNHVLGSGKETPVTAPHSPSNGTSTKGNVVNVGSVSMVGVSSSGMAVESVSSRSIFASRNTVVPEVVPEASNEVGNEVVPEVLYGHSGVGSTGVHKRHHDASGVSGVSGLQSMSGESLV